MQAFSVSGWGYFWVTDHAPKSRHDHAADRDAQADHRRIVRVQFDHAVEWAGLQVGKV
jgi:hypothetical protein